eukprot:12165652-Heterocapsa_arctica.AAC.1
MGTKLEVPRRARSIRKPRTWTSPTQMTQEDACWSTWKRGSRLTSSAQKDRTRHNFSPTATSSRARRSARPRFRKRRRPCLAWRKVVYTFQGLAFRFVGKYDCKGNPKFLKAHWEPARPSARGGEQEGRRDKEEEEEPEEEAKEGRSESEGRRSRSRS